MDISYPSKPPSGAGLFGVWIILDPHLSSMSFISLVSDGLESPTQLKISLFMA